MSNSRVDSGSPTPAVQVEPARARQTTEPSTPFGQVLNAGASALVAGASVVSGVVGGPALAAVVRDAGNQLVGSSSGAGGGVGAIASGGGSELEQSRAMQRESQAFSLQLLGLQQEVQDENRRFTTLSNVLKASHETAKAAVSNIRS